MVKGWRRGLVASHHSKSKGSLSNLHLIKMFTNGMSESIFSKVLLQDVPVEAFQAVLEFMYCGELVSEDTTNIGTLLIQLLLLADQFGVTLLHQECCKTLLECLSEGWSSPIGRRSYNQEFFYYAQV